MGEKVNNICMSEPNRPMAVTFTDKRNHSNLIFDKNDLGNKDLYFNEARYELLPVSIALLRIGLNLCAYSIHNRKIPQKRKYATVCFIEIGIFSRRPSTSRKFLVYFPPELFS